MARKKYIRSMRFSDFMIEIIESQQGRNFSEKFEGLVIRCMWEVPEKEKRIAELDKQIAAREQLLTKLSLELQSDLSAAARSASFLREEVEHLHARL